MAKFCGSWLEFCDEKRTLSWTAKVMLMEFAAWLLQHENKE